ncbi:MAG: F0F1 ATP synthase subunit epsilon, partial [Gammaproteobacteria bacterium]|nr:F0F1 ATP synthase subunit epsilon [Gammaproteobacteria bacterium]
MSTIRVEIVSAEEEIWSGEGSMVFAPGELGELGIAPKHTPLVTRLKPGDVRVQQEDGGEQFFFISGGLLEVQPHLVTVLSDTAIRADDLDQAAAEAAQKRAEEAIRDQT